MLKRAELTWVVNESLTDEAAMTAARNIGQKAPLLIDELGMKALPTGSVVIDLGTGEGGSVVGSQGDKTLAMERNISVVNVSGYPKAEPRKASEAYALCMVNLLQDAIVIRHYAGMAGCPMT